MRPRPHGALQAEGAVRGRQGRRVLEVDLVLRVHELVVGRERPIPSFERPPRSAPMPRGSAWGPTCRPCSGCHVALMPPGESGSRSHRKKNSSLARRPARNRAPRSRPDGTAHGAPGVGGRWVLPDGCRRRCSTRRPSSHAPGSSSRGRGRRSGQGSPPRRQPKGCAQVGPITAEPNASPCSICARTRL